MLRACLRTLFGGMLRRATLIAALIATQRALSAPPMPTSPDSGVPVSSIDLRPVFKNWGLDLFARNFWEACEIARSQAPAARLRSQSV